MAPGRRVDATPASMQAIDLVGVDHLVARLVGPDDDGVADWPLGIDADLDGDTGLLHSVIHGAHRHDDVAVGHRQPSNEHLALARSNRAERCVGLSVGIALSVARQPNRRIVLPHPALGVDNPPHLRVDEMREALVDRESNACVHRVSDMWRRTGRKTTPGTEGRAACKRAVRVRAGDVCSLRTWMWVGVRPRWLASVALLTLGGVSS